MSKTLLGESTAGQALLEKFEDCAAEAVKHMKDNRTVEGKPCTITLKVKVTPNPRRDRFKYEVSDSVSFSPRASAESSIYAEVDEHGDVVHNEFSPQPEIPFGKVGE